MMAKDSKDYALKKFEKFSLIDVIKGNIVFIVLILLLLAINFIKIPYQVEMPGGVINLSDRIKVDGKELDVKGSYNMAYVEVAQGSIVYYLLAHIFPDWEIVKTSEVVYASSESIEDANKRDVIMMEQSKDMAIIAALEAAKVPYEITKTQNKVVYVDEKANTGIKIGDSIVEVDGVKVDSIENASNEIQKKEVGQKISIKVVRDGKEIETIGELFEQNGPKIGIAAVDTYDIECDKKISIASNESESGPSGGMMMALMIYSGVTNKDLTKGRKIVGTGTITKEGNVGDIGGVKFKVMGAAKAKADVFLVPEGNYEEAMEVAKKKKYKIEIVKVSTLQDAIDYLEGE